MVYYLWGGNEGKTIFGLNNFILTKVTVQSINDVSLTDRASNNLRGNAIGLGTVYVCDVTHSEIPETIFSRGKLHYDAFILEG